MKGLRPEFTFEFRLVVEGGQPDALFFGIFDRCHRNVPPSLQLGFETEEQSGEQKGRLTARLQSTSSNHTLLLRMPTALRIHHEETIAITLNQKEVRFYRNGALEQLAFNTLPASLFAEVESPCKTLQLFPNAFRGTLRSFRLWSRSLDQSGLRTVREADYEVEYGPELPKSRTEITIPPCGVTICDHPAVLQKYWKQEGMRKAKVLRYRVSVLSNDDGSNPVVSDEQIAVQHAALNAAFAPYNLSWELEVERRMNSSLRRKTVVFGCDQSSTDSEHPSCNPGCRGLFFDEGSNECNQTGHCKAEWLKNGVCNDECNTPLNHWDGGDCCRGADDDECFEPHSPFRKYLEVAEYKQLLNAENTHSLAVHLLDWEDEQLIGLSTFPWETRVFGPQGGILLHSTKFGLPNQTHNLIHEMGHILGLFHTHHGVDELGCESPCHEFEASMIRGDLLSDTTPTSKHTSCGDPTDAEVCGRKRSFFNTPFSNFMSYSGHECVREFTPQQAARMHCYVDLKYANRWSAEGGHSFPLDPWISVEELDGRRGLRVNWAPPIDQEFCRPIDARSPDSFCSRDGRLVQFAARATANHSFEFGDRWAPSQATGAPDAESCSPSTRAWLPDVEACDGPDKCTLELELELPVRLSALFLWVAWNAAEGVRAIELHPIDNTSVTLENPSIQCDAPFSARLDVQAPVHKIKVITTNPFVSVDALKFISLPDDPKCAYCPQFLYEIEREPPFVDGRVVVKEETFVDWDVDSTQNYTYTIHLVDEDGRHFHSISAHYNGSSGRCGDGIVNTAAEECDDGNREEADGCSAFCTLEDGFTCEGSLCHRIDVLDTSGRSLLVLPKDVRLLSNGEFICQLERIRPVGRCEWADFGPSNCFAMTSKMETSVEVNVGIDRPHSLLVFFAASQHFEDHAANGTINVEFLAESGERLQLLTRSVRSCADSPLLLKMSAELTELEGLVARIRVAAHHSLAIFSVGFLIDASNHGFSLCQHGEMAATCSHSSSNAPPNCTPPPFNPHFNLDCSHGLCRVECADGSRTVDGLELALRCVAGKWIGEDALALGSHVCSPVNCGPPLLPPASSARCPNGHELGATCEVECEQNAISLVGNTPATIECSASGWSPTELFCVPSCSTDGLSEWNVLPSSVRCRSETNELFGRSDALLWPSGSECTAGCSAGHFVESKRKQNNTSFSCSPSGEWVGGKCERLRCPASSIFRQAAHCTDGRNVGSRCTHNCSTNAGYQVRSVFCLPNARWSRKFACPLKSRAYCEHPADSHHLSFECPKFVNSGSNCSVSCQAKGYDVVYENKRADSLLTAVSNLSCTPNGHFFPRTAKLKCVRSCSKEFFADGFCDFYNNRGYCRFDGGDCCNSTARSGHVRFMFPMLCSSFVCRCIDPKAVENLGSRPSITNDGVWFGQRRRLRASGDPFGRSSLADYSLLHFLHLANRQPPPL